MNDKLQRIFGQLIITILPYIIAGIAITFAIGLLILFYYVVIWGIVIGIVLWLAAFIRRHLFKKNTPIQPHTGRVINHDQNRDE